MRRTADHKAGAASHTASPCRFACRFSFSLYLGCSSATCEEEFVNQEKFIDAYKNQNVTIVSSFGIHPQNPSVECLEYEEFLLQNNKISAIGEIGIDLFSEEFKKNNIEPKRIQFIYPKMNSESNLVLVDGRKNGKVGLKVLAPLYVHNEDGSYTDEVLKLFGKC